MYKNKIYQLYFNFDWTHRVRTVHRMNFAWIEDHIHERKFYWKLIKKKTFQLIEYKYINNMLIWQTKIKTKSFNEFYHIQATTTHQ